MVTWLGQGHTVGKWQSRDLNSGLWSPEPTVLILCLLSFLFPPTFKDIHVCVRICVCRCLQRPKEGDVSAGAGVTGNVQPYHEGAGI